ncbi:MAG: DNA gyrase inhibitor YacG [Planctomycetota bacterium]
MEHKCPVCHKAVRAPVQEQSEEVKVFPFCCRRCKLLDLGAWLDVKYRIASGSQSQGSSEPSDTVSPRF